MKRMEETAVVKRALKNYGFGKENNVRVKHGNGTAWGWITVYADIHRSPSCSCGAPDEYGRRETCEPCKKYWRETYNRLLEITLEATGRKGDYDGRTGITLDFIE